MALRKAAKRIIHPILKPVASWYFSKERSYRYKNIRITVLPGVFHPQLIISTRLLLQFLEGEALEGCTFLELGCGSGILSVMAAQKGAFVTASDISEKAVENALKNAAKNEVEVQGVHSNLFEELQLTFDYILVNPPYYPKQPQQESEYAWYCGEEFEYFHQLFAQLPDRLGIDAKVIMILSEDCDLTGIQNIAATHNFEFELLQEKKVAGERNFIFRINKVG